MPQQANSPQRKQTAESKNVFYLYLHMYMNRISLSTYYETSSQFKIDYNYKLTEHISFLKKCLVYRQNKTVFFLYSCIKKKPLCGWWNDEIEARGRRSSTPSFNHQARPWREELSARQKPSLPVAYSSDFSSSWWQCHYRKKGTHRIVQDSNWTNKCPWTRKTHTHTISPSLYPHSLSFSPLSLFLAHTHSHEGWNNSLADAVLSGFMQLINAQVRVCWGHCHWRGRNGALAACISAITVWIAWEDYMECLREPGCLILSTKNSCLGPMHLLVNRPFSPSPPSETRTFSFFYTHSHPQWSSRKRKERGLRNKAWMSLAV